SNSTIIYAAKIELHGDQGFLSLPTNEWPIGLASVAILTEEGRPLAQRTIYVAPKNIFVTIQPDSSLYHTHSSIRVHIKLTDNLGNGVQGVFSFASLPVGRRN